MRRHPGLVLGAIVGAFLAVAVPVSRRGPVPAPAAPAPPAAVAPARAAADPLGATVLLVDTSGSRAADLAAEVALVEGVARAIAADAGPATRLVVAAFDQAVAVVHDGPAGALDAAGAGAIGRRGALGATDLARALGWAGERARAAGARRVVIVTDGVATAGALGADAIARAARALGEAGVERIDAIAIGEARDEAALAAVTRAGLARAGVVVPASLGAEAIAARLGAGAPAPVAAVAPASAAPPPDDPAPAASARLDDRAAADLAAELAALDGEMASALGRAERTRPTLRPPIARDARALGGPEAAVGRAAAVAGPAAAARPRSKPRAAPPVEPGPAPIGPRFAAVRGLVAAGSAAAAVDAARAWRREAPGDAIAIVALGEALAAAGDVPGATRAIGSLVDLGSAGADDRRLAAAALLGLGRGDPEAIAIDALRAAHAARPELDAVARALALAWLRAGAHEAAFDVLAAALARPSPARPPHVDRLLREDLGLVAAAWIASDPPREPDVRARVAAAGAAVEDAPSLRFVLAWDAGGPDADLRVRDARGAVADRAAPALPSGGELYGDVTEGGGPEAFVVRGARDRRAGPYAIAVGVEGRGARGFAAGVVEVIDHDGRGGLVIDARPFVVEADRATVDLGAAR